MPDPTCPPTLTHLTMTFDPNRQRPDRFAPDPRDAGRPDPNRETPGKPMSPDEVGQLIMRGNAVYTGFIARCKATTEEHRPLSAAGQGEHTFRLFLNDEQIGIGENSHEAHQSPYAAVLGCIDARVPPELITGQAANDMFAVRTAGNIMLDYGEARGSLEFILGKYARRPGDSEEDPGDESAKGRTLSAVLVLGHTRCGAIAAAYDAAIADRDKSDESDGGRAGASLDAIVDRLKAFVRIVMALDPKETDPVVIQDRVCIFNTIYNYLDIEAMAEAAGVRCDGFRVFYGSYHVDDGVIRSSNLPDTPETEFEEKLRAAAEAERVKTDLLGSFQRLSGNGIEPVKGVVSYRSQPMDGPSQVK